MAEDLDGFYVHTVTVRPLQGTGAYGQVFGDPVEVDGFLDSATRLVRSGTGAETVSQSTFYCRPRHVSEFRPGSRVDLPDGRRTTVVAALPRTSASLGLPDHLEVQLA